MKRQVSKWDEHLQVFMGLTYEEKLDYWIEHRFFKMHHCFFNAKDAIRVYPTKAKELKNKTGEFSIVPANDLELDQFIDYILNNLELLANESLGYEIRGLRQIIEDFERKSLLADDVTELVREELEFINSILEHTYQVKGGAAVNRGFRDSSTGELQGNITREVLSELDCLYFFGAVLSKYKKYLQDGSLNSLKNIETKRSPVELNLTTRVLLIQIMQECGLFPAEHHIAMNAFLSQLLGEREASIETARKKIPKLLTGKLTKSQKEQFLPQIKKLMPILVDLNNQSLLNKYNEILGRIERVK